MKKVGVLILLMLVVLSAFALAQEDSETEAEEIEETEEVIDETSGLDLAYQCVEELLDETETSDLSLSSALFSVLARGSDAELQEHIESLGDDDECWPKEGGCKIAETSQTLLAYDRIGKNTDNIESWLMDRSDTSNDLTWFLQVDITNHIPATCTLGYDGSQHTISVNEDMTLSGNPGSCLEITSSGYWLKIKGSCLDNEYQISCDEDFVTSLLYQKDGSSTIFVSPNTHGSDSSGTTQEKVNSLCFKSTNRCDYEGTLWAALALDKLGHDITAYLPYLLALAEDNQRYFPETFIYSITGGDDQYSKIIQSQKQEQFWQAPGTKYNKFYDTALALLSLQGSSAPEASNSLDYLLGIQTPKGCWNNDNLRDTAFLLYAGWPKAVGSSPGPGGITPVAQCSDAPGFCVGSTLKCAQEGGQILSNFDCTNSIAVCCSVDVVPPTCAEQGGEICFDNEQCSGGVVDSIDGSCCLERCEEVIDTQNQCEQNGGICDDSCKSDEKEEPYSCSITGDVCCVADDSEPEPSSFPWVTVLLLGILIILVIIAIVKRESIKKWFANRKGGANKPGSQGPPTKPGQAPGFGRPPMRRGPPPRMMRPGMPPNRRPMPQRGAPNTKTDKELNATLKKLKEIGG